MIVTCNHVCGIVVVISSTVHVRTHAHATHVRTRTYTHTHTLHVRVRTYTCTHCICVHVHTHAHTTYVRTHAHTVCAYTYTHTACAYTEECFPRLRLGHTSTPHETKLMLHAFLGSNLYLSIYLVLTRSIGTRIRVHFPE